MTNDTRRTPRAAPGPPTAVRVTFAALDSRFRRQESTPRGPLRPGQTDRPERSGKGSVVFSDAEKLRPNPPSAASSLRRGVRLLGVGEALSVLLADLHHPAGGLHCVYLWDRRGSRARG